VVAIGLEEAKANTRYWLTLMDRNPEGPSYYGKVLDFDADFVTVEIEVMAPHHKRTVLSKERWPREQTLVFEDTE
jgi:hypothetical protein